MPTTTTASPTAPLAFSQRGPAGGEPLILIAGLGSQSLFWPEGFCRHLEDRGFRLILPDNRDVGLSPKTPGEPPPVAALLGGQGGEAAYTLDDMAADILLLMDHLELPRVHLLGNSMGGMIAQTLALAAGSRAQSLTSMMSAPGSQWLITDSDTASRSLGTAVGDPGQYVDTQLEGYRAISGPHFDGAGIRDMLERSFQRAYHPAGWSFQMQAILASGDRTARLRELRLPTLVIHGRLDPLIPLAAAEATAAAIPGAHLLVFDDMAHDLSPPHWEPVAEAVANLAGEASSP